MNERIRMIREILGCSRSAFGEKLGVSGDVINNLERGRVEIKEHIIKLICSIYSVQEEWLRNGAGEMFVQQTETDELAAAVNRLMSGESTDFKRRLISVLSTLKDDQWYTLQEKLEEIVGMRDIPSMPAFSPQIDSTPSAMAEAEALYENSSGYAQNTSSSASSTTEDTESTGKVSLA